MIATAPPNSRSATTHLEFEHLLLGDLRQLLDEDQGRDRDRWLLATLDMLLVSRPRTAVVYLPVIPRDVELGSRAITAGDRLLPFEKLQRLRDRIAHRAPYEILANELSVELGLYFDGVKLRSVQPIE